tara:strand:+ start:265 stop:945 length:681 start_codon:yes stop_codon:yes gene_type:complete
MRGEKLIANIQNPMQIGNAEIANMHISLQAFPYFSTLQLLYTKGLYNTDSISYNRQLRKAAAFAGNRKLLFKLITENVKETEVVERKKVEENTQKRAAEKELNIGKPLDFNREETHSFAEWLSLTKVKKIDRTANQNQGDLIDTFIENEPRISKPKKETFFSPAETAKESLLENDSIVTETLARVYLEQGHYDKAITSYEKLSLKFPQKSTLFANQIKLIYDLKEK